MHCDDVKPRTTVVAFNSDWTRDKLRCEVIANGTRSITDERMRVCEPSAGNQVVKEIVEGHLVRCMSERMVTRQRLLTRHASGVRRSDGMLLEPDARSYILTARA